MKKTIILFAVFATILSTASRVQADVESAIQTYGTVGKALMEDIITQNIDASTVSTQVNQLVENGMTLVKAYMVKYPETEPVLKVFVAKIDDIKQLDFETLEKDWHDSEYFQRAGNEVDFDFEDEDLEHVLDPLHAVIHPLLTLRTAEAYDKDPSSSHIQVMKEEMGEGLEQLKNVSNALGH